MEANLSFAIATRFRSVSLSQQDPADRFIAATALEMKLHLLAADDRLGACPELHCIA